MAENHLKFKPAVFLVGNKYQIMFCTDCKGLAGVEICGKIYTDNINGVVRSETLVHRITVPRPVLDAAGAYTVRFAKLDQHEAYWNKPEETYTEVFKFTPAPEKNAHFYMLADTHSAVEAPVAAVNAQKPDLLIFNGDIGEDADRIDTIQTVYAIAEKVTGGSHPVIYSRGNHDTRGHFAEFLGDYVGNDNGKTYYTFRIGEVWGVVLDAGEDKNDACAEYGGVADFTAFREAQTEFLQDIIANASSEYADDGVKYRVAICHMAFTRTEKYFTKPGQIEYNKWISALNKIGISTLFCGHCHDIDRLPDGEYRGNGEKPDFEVIIGANWNNNPVGDKRWLGGQYTGTDIKFERGSINVSFTNCLGQTVEFNK